MIFYDLHKNQVLQGTWYIGPAQTQGGTVFYFTRGPVRKQGILEFILEDTNGKNHILTKELAEQLVRISPAHFKEVLRRDTKRPLKGGL